MLGFDDLQAREVPQTLVVQGLEELADNLPCVYMQSHYSFTIKCPLLPNIKNSSFSGRVQIALA